MIRPVRRRPKLLVELELERNRARVCLYADSHEDELRLRSWLRRSSAFATLPEALERLLDELDRIDEDAA